MSCIDDIECNNSGAVVLLVCGISNIEAGPTEKPTTAKSEVTASKDVKDAIQKAKEAKKVKKECMKLCPAIYDPVCAHDPTDITFKPRSFGSTCSLGIHNCDMGTSKFGGNLRPSRDIRTSLPLYLPDIRLGLSILLSRLMRGAWKNKTKDSNACGT
jgi:hypothetical protein